MNDTAFTTLLSSSFYIPADAGRWCAHRVIPQVAEKGKEMRREIVSIPVLSIRIVPGKTFGFAKLGDWGSDAFVSPPLMRAIGGKVPPHAIVGKNERGRYISDFLNQPQTRLVWEGFKDEARMIALAPEIAKKWFSLMGAGGSPVAISDYDHEEFSSLWSAACSAGEADKFLVRFGNEFLTPAKRAEVIRHQDQLFRRWKRQLPTAVTEKCEIVSKPELHHINFGSLFRPWWFEYSLIDVQQEVDTIRTPFVSAVIAVENTARIQHEEANAIEKKRWQAEQKAEYIRQRQGVVKGLEMAGLGDLATEGLVTRILREWPMAGQYFPQIEQFRRYENAPVAEELHALRWYREHRSEQVSQMFDNACAHANVETGRSWTESSTWDPTYDNEAHGGDGMKGSGNFVGGGPRFDRYQWSVDALSRINAVDEAAGFRANLDQLVAIEVCQRMGDLDSETLGPSKLPWATEEMLFLPESKEKFRAILAAAAEKSRAQKELELRAAGLRADEARIASKNAAEERRLRSIASVRSDWRTKLRWVKASGGYKGLHPDAQALLEKIREAQSKATIIRGRNEAARRLESEKQAQNEIEEKNKAQKLKKDSFLSVGAWGALDSFKSQK